MTQRMIPVVYDERLPDSSLPRSDPSNPKNLVKSLLTVADQTKADTKYDVRPPPYERAGFTNPPSAVEKFLGVPQLPTLALLAAVLMVLVVLLMKPFSTPLRVVLSVGVIVALHTLAGRVSRV